MESLWNLQASEASALLASGTISVESYASACLERIVARESEVGAWAFLDPDGVIREARRLDALHTRGPLHGLPIGIKDVFLTEGMPTRYNSPNYEIVQQTPDAAAVRILRASGALIFGKTTTVEFASTGRVPRTHNPHDRNRTPGGSSSGSAAAVADFHVPLTLGTQTGGSLIRPASFCGVCAFKPTWGAICNEGAKAFSPTLDTVGWFARSVSDLRLVFNVFQAQPHPPLELRALRIAICRTPMWAESESATQAAMQACEDRLHRSGVSVEVLELPESFEPLTSMHRSIMRREGGASFLAEYRAGREALHQDLRAQVENHDNCNDRELLDAYDHVASCRKIFDQLAAPFDAVLTPSTVGVAPLGIESTGSLTFNAMWTALHTPCVNLAGIRSSEGLPVGLTLTGPRYCDQHVLEAALLIEPLLPGIMVV